MKRLGKLTATVLLALMLFPLVKSTRAFSASSAGQVGKVDFVRDIQPILQTHCVGCHGPQKAMSQLRLDSKRSAARIITPGDAKTSRLLQRVLGEGGEDRMPKGGAPLNAAQIDLLRRWINEGANWPDSASVQLDEKQTHWAFNAPVRPALPNVKNAARVSSPVDRFILAALEKQGLMLSPEADRATLIRRLSLDLIGLPPTLKEIDDFLADASPNAYEKLVDRLLASPHYGERAGDAGGWTPRATPTPTV
ncbi:MAG: DUF1549 domain-containing protein [Acidobacteriota bacterium]